MKIKDFDILNYTNSYDENQNTIFGKITEKVINGINCLGAGLVKYRNTVSIENIVPNDVYLSSNNRCFVTTTELVGLVNIALYNINPDTNEISYVGKITFNVFDTPATTHTVRGLRVIDDGFSGWKIFWLSTANVLANGGLYMVNDVALSDFQTLPVNFPTATAPSQKAVYKLENSPFDITTSAGISINKNNQKIYVHAGVAANHRFYAFNYNDTITTVSGGITTDLFDFVTGTLPALTGTLLLTNSEEFTQPTSGSNSGEDCVIFFTTTNAYRLRYSDLSSGSTTIPSVEIVNVLPDVDSLTAQTAARATMMESLQKMLILSGSDILIIKDFADSVHDELILLEGYEWSEKAGKTDFLFGASTMIGLDVKNGYAVLISAVVGQRGLYAANIDSIKSIKANKIITKVIDVDAEVLTSVKINQASNIGNKQVFVRYRTGNFDNPNSGWINLGEDLSIPNVLSPSGKVQFELSFGAERCNLNYAQIASVGVEVVSLNAISDNWEFSNTLTEDTIAPKVVFRLKKEYDSLIPKLFFRSYSLNNTLVVEENTEDNSANFEYSTNNGVTWNNLGTIPNAIGTMLRYSFQSPVGVDIRPSLRE